ncbi:MAG: universal stress protein [Pseudomonadota bacterium]
MFNRIMVPVDLAHADQAGKALALAADLAKRYGAEATIVGVTQSAPTAVAPTPEAFAERLAAFATGRSGELGTTFATRAEVSHDITVDLDDALERAATAIGADLVVMASHVPGFASHLFASNAGYLAAHATISVFVVR